ncbi:MAG TPA: Gfo/Idh/MocA family oxidoreductase, partial [Gemmataceae bacterium]
DIAEDQWVDGAQVVIGCPGESKLSPERIPGFKKAIAALGVPLVDKPEDMIGKVDGMLIESVEGGVHFDRAKPFLEAGLPCFIDKPFTCGVEDAKKIVELAEKKKALIFSSSSLRYTPDLVQFVNDEKRGKVLGVLAYGPAPLHERNPGLYHYGIHPVEVLYSVMGPGCQRVTCTHEKDVDMVTGQWKDGRVAGVRGQRPESPYGLVAFTEKGVKHVSLDMKYGYRELLKKIVEFFDKKKAPVDMAETVEIMAFIEAALKSANNHGVGEKVAIV